MQLRPAAILLALGLTLAAATGCSEQVTGSATADTNATTTRPTATTPTSRRTPATTAAKPTRPTSQKTGDVKIGTKKKSTGLETCGVLKSADVEAATGGKASADGGCIVTTTDPTAVITQLVTIPGTMEREGEKKQIEIGGNTAWQVASSGENCQVTVMLTDDPAAVTSAFSVSVLAFDKFDACAAALKLAQQGFDRIPNA
ncbi:hypothetical protein [Lentzea sp. NPDC060358]|uniref:hypothetical protein n=1 Tax=Lentzea sp. NPDC060358 TaxID=3347103 RepID=UPI00365C32D1